MKYNLMDKSKVAREWLLFLGSLAFGLILLPFSIILMVKIFSNMSTEYNILESYGKFISIPFKVVTKEDQLLFLTFACGPYLVMQLIRSILWSIKMIKKAK